MSEFFLCVLRAVPGSRCLINICTTSMNDSVVITLRLALCIMKCPCLYLDFVTINMCESLPSSSEWDIQAGTVWGLGVILTLATSQLGSSTFLRMCAKQLAQDSGLTSVPASFSYRLHEFLLV